MPSFEPPRISAWLPLPYPRSADKEGGGFGAALSAGSKTRPFRPCLIQMSMADKQQLPRHISPLQRSARFQHPPLLLLQFPEQPLHLLIAFEHVELIVQRVAFEQRFAGVIFGFHILNAGLEAPQRRRA